MRVSRLVLQIVFIVFTFGLGFVIGGYRKSYLISRFDLVVTPDTEVKLRSQQYDVLHYENAVRLWSAYRTIQSLPSWVTMFRPSDGMSLKQQEEWSAVIHDMLLKHFEKDFDKSELAVFVQRHLGEAKPDK